LNRFIFVARTGRHPGTVAAAGGFHKKAGSGSCLSMNSGSEGGLPFVPKTT
jgi:hypothetical protein